MKRKLFIFCVIMFVTLQLSAQSGAPTQDNIVLYTGIALFSVTESKTITLQQWMPTYCDNIPIAYFSQSVTPETIKSYLERELNHHPWATYSINVTLNQSGSGSGTGYISFLFYGPYTSHDRSFQLKSDSHTVSIILPGNPGN